jgi:DMSO reductase anchor subunit
VFTLLTALLVGWLSTLSAAGLGRFAFLAAGVVGAALSTLHLGQKFRAFRAVLNWRRSWLSREIILFSVFMMIAAVHLLANPASVALKWTAIAAGFAALLAMDSVYGVTGTKGLRLHSAQVLLSGVLFLATFQGNAVVCILMATLKLILYLSRKRRFAVNDEPTRQLASALRIVLGSLAPIGLWLVAPDALAVPAAFCVVIGEIIDRCEYYAELEVPTPRRQMDAVLADELATMAGR